MAGGQRVCVQHFLQILRRIPGAVSQARDVGPDTVRRASNARSVAQEGDQPAFGGVSMATVASEPAN